MRFDERPQSRVVGLSLCVNKVGGRRKRLSSWWWGMWCGQFAEAAMKKWVQIPILAQCNCGGLGSYCSRLPTSTPGYTFLYRLTRYYANHCITEQDQCAYFFFHSLSCSPFQLFYFYFQLHYISSLSTCNSLWHIIWLLVSYLSLLFLFYSSHKL